MTDNTREILLTQGCVALVDASDYERLSQFNWFALRTHSDTFYAIRNLTRADGKRGGISMHRQIMDAPKGMFVDHANHDTLDNRRANLRMCTREENARNRSSMKGATSQYLGVSWYKTYGKWVVRISTCTGRKHVGYFDCELEAATAYDKAARIHHGEFANPNFTR